MTRIDREKETVKAMIVMYCHDHHPEDKGFGKWPCGLCDDCLELYEYAANRLDHCVFGNEKPTCDNCHIHCYRYDRRDEIREVMRYSGPRMILHHPIMAIRHLMRKIK